MYKLYRIDRNGIDGMINWLHPDGNRYTLNTNGIPENNGWRITRNAANVPVMALKSEEPGKDSTLVLSIDGAASRIATLMNAEDDIPRKYYHACDSGNSINSLGIDTWVNGNNAFILKAEGYYDSPVQIFCDLYVMVLDSEEIPQKPQIQIGPNPWPHKRAPYGRELEAEVSIPVNNNRDVEVNLVFSPGVNITETSSQTAKILIRKGRSTSKFRFQTNFPATIGDSYSISAFAGEYRSDSVSGTIEDPF